jgi:hypothetical protein
MGELLLLMQAYAAIEPVVAAALPAIEALINGQSLTPAQEESLVQARLAVEAQAKAGA